MINSNDKNDKISMQYLGIETAHRLEWNGLKIMKAFIFALEDSNFHKENTAIAKAIHEMYKDESWVDQGFKNFISMYSEVDD